MRKEPPIYEKAEKETADPQSKDLFSCSPSGSDYFAGSQNPGDVSPYQASPYCL